MPIWYLIDRFTVGTRSLEVLENYRWRGFRDQALSDLSGIPGCIFVHQAGFIGGELCSNVIKSVLHLC